MKIDRHTMTIGDVARALDLSTARINQLDAELQPVYLHNRHRRYDPAQVERFAAGRGK